MDIFYRTHVPADTAPIPNDNDVPDLVFNGSPWRPGSSWSVIASRRAVPDPEGNNYNIFLLDVSTAYTTVSPTAPSFPYAFASTSSTPYLTIFTWTPPS
jgi:hypothetical protein